VCVCVCVCIHNEALHSHKKEWNYIIYIKMDGTGNHHAEEK
jgi:hypothetical protein